MDYYEYNVRICLALLYPPQALDKTAPDAPGSWLRCSSCCSLTRVGRAENHVRRALFATAVPWSFLWSFFPPAVRYCGVGGGEWDRTFTAPGRPADDAASAAAAGRVSTSPPVRVSCRSRRACGWAGAGCEYRGWRFFVLPHGMWMRWRYCTMGSDGDLSLNVGGQRWSGIDSRRARALRGTT